MNVIGRKEDRNAQEIWYGLCNVFDVHVSMIFLFCHSHKLNDNFIEK